MKHRNAVGNAIALLVLRHVVAGATISLTQACSACFWDTLDLPRPILGTRSALQPARLFQLSRSRHLPELPCERGEPLPVDLWKWAL